jgi:hypothetical protein
MYSGTRINKDDAFFHSFKSPLPPPSSSCITDRRKAKKEEMELNKAFFQSFKSPLPHPLLILQRREKKS